MYWSDILPGGYESDHSRRKLVIIRYKLAELVKKVPEAGSRSPAAMFQVWQDGEPNPVLPLPCFKHDRRVDLSDILPVEPCYPAVMFQA